MDEDVPPDNQQVERPLSREELDRLVTITTTAFENRLENRPLNGEAEAVSQFYRDLSSRTTQIGVQRNSRRIDRIQRMLSQFKGKYVDGATFTSVLYEFREGLPQIDNMPEDTVRRYLGALKAYQDEPERKF